MILLAVTIFFAILFVVSFVIDKRRFRNAVYLTMMALWGLLYLAVDVNNDAFRQFTFIIVFFFLPFLLLVMSFVFIACGVISIVRESMSVSMCMSIAFGIGVWLPLIIGIIILLLPDMSGGIPNWLVYFEILISVLDMYIVYTFTAMLIYSTIYGIIPKNKHCKYVIILGAGLIDGNKVSPLLAGRIDKAIKAATKMKGTPKFIVSGGQGADETVSEARAMADYMINKGIDEDNIYLEDKSTNTKENLQFSYEIIKKDKTFDKKSKAIFVTNNYHVFRASLFAKKAKIKADGIGCKTAFYYWPNAFVREYIAVILRFKIVFLLIFLVWIAGVVISEM